MGKSFILRSLYFTLFCIVHAHLPCPPPLGNGRMRQINKNANKLKSIFISNNSFYLLQLKGCHERHLLTIYAILIKKAVNAWFVGKNIGKKMGSNGAALTIV